MTFLLFTVLKSVSGKNKLKYPSRIKCDNIDHQFEDDKEQYESLAGTDKAHVMKLQGNGQYMCYCKKYGSISDISDSQSICY